MIRIHGRPAHLIVTDDMFDRRLDELDKTTPYLSDMSADFYFVSRFPSFEYRVRPQLAADILEDYEDE